MVGFAGANFIRYQIIPLAGEHGLTEDEARKTTPNSLMDELPVRIAQGPVRFRLMAQVANDGDAITDATVRGLSTASASSWAR